MDALSRGPARFLRRPARGETVMKTDSQLQRDILDEFGHNQALNAAEVSVSVKDGVATLNGCANTFPEKRAAEQAALRVAGIKAVANRIAVPGRSFW